MAQFHKLHLQNPEPKDKEKQKTATMGALRFFVALSEAVTCRGHVGHTLTARHYFKK
ncbi:MAG: hypothetical protein L3J84_09570 [Gammaproteobacteria bacterium]|nr:hypothetical protein [Gammaproteobacteria bacterium]